MEKFHFIERKIQTEKEYTFPIALTRYYGRVDFFADQKKQYLLCYEYDFQAEIYLNGNRIPANNGKVELNQEIGLRGGVNKIGIKMYLSDNPMRFLPALHFNILENGTTIIRSSDVRFTTYPAFYTEYEPDDWFESEVEENMSQTYWNHPREIKRPYYFKKHFEISKPVKKAVFKGSAKGFYKAFINGKKVGNGELLPGVTGLDESGFPFKAVSVEYFNEFDITEHINVGNNVVAGLVGNGYNASEGFNAVRVEVPKIAVKIEIQYTDNTVEIIETDESWLLAKAPMLENDLQYGVRYDANEEFDWMNSDERFQEKAVRSSCNDVLKKQEFPNVEVVDTISPVQVIHLENSNVYDFGQLIAGRCRVQLQNLPKDQIVVLRYAEKLTKDNQLSIEEYLDVLYYKDTEWDGIAKYGAKNIDTYCSDGKPIQEFIPDFCYTGFRYIEVLCPTQCVSEITALRMRTNVPVRLTINTSDPMLNSISKASIESCLNNMFFGMTDCPTREKNFWNGDLNIMASTFFYVFDAKTLMEEWILYGRKIESDAPCWIDALYEIPYQIYLFYKDTSCLEKNFERIKGLTDKRIAEAKDGVYLSENSLFYGDHARPFGFQNVEKEFFAQCFFVRNLDRMVQILGFLGKKELIPVYLNHLENAKEAFYRKYFERIKQWKSDENMTYLILPLAFDILQSDDRQYVADQLNEAVIKNQYTCRCGVIGASEILNCLSDNGHHETAFRLATSTNYPSWGAMIQTGATSVTEYYEGFNAKNHGDSFSHYYFAAYLRFVVEKIGGYSPDGKKNPTNMYGLEYCDIKLKDLKKTD